MVDNNSSPKKLHLRRTSAANTSMATSAGAPQRTNQPTILRRSPRFLTHEACGRSTLPGRHHIKFWIDGEVSEFKSVPSEKVQAVILLLASGDVSSDASEECNEGVCGNAGRCCIKCGINIMSAPKMRRGTNGPMIVCNTCELARSKSNTTRAGAAQPLSTTGNSHDSS